MMIIATMAVIVPTSAASFTVCMVGGVVAVVTTLYVHCTGLAGMPSQS